MDDNVIYLGEGINGKNERYLYAYHRASQVAAIDYGGQYVELTEPRSWVPGDPILDAMICDAINVFGANGKRNRAFTLDALRSVARQHFGR